MHRDQRDWIKPFFILALLLILCCFQFTPVLADEGPHRTKEIHVEYTEHYWWLVRESDNYVECELVVDHEDIPASEEIFHQCGLEAYEGWMDEASCEAEDPDQATSCYGFYYQHVGESLQSKVIDLELPPVIIKLVPPKCSSLNEESCEAIPRLQFVAEDPLPNEEVTQIRGRFNHIPFTCEGQSCEIQLRETGNQGVSLEFWSCEGRCSPTTSAGSTQFTLYNEFTP